MLAGGAVVVYGIFSALAPLIGLYQGALNDPLNQPEGTELNTSKAMLAGIGIGAIGAPFLLTGVVLTRIAAFRRRRARRAAV
jgi:hypothetical protein